MRRQILATAAAMACAGVMTAAQNPGNPGQQSDPARPSTGAQADSRAGEQGTTTLTGCVYREADVPGRTPNVAERAGILEDYILAVSSTSSATSGRSAVGTSGESGAAGQDRDADQDRPGAADPDRADASPARQGATGTSGRAAASMFKLEHTDDDQLQAMVGKRVQVMGKIDAEAGDTPASGAQAGDQSVGPDRIELPEFEVSSIREVAGTCPSTPSNQ